MDADVSVALAATEKAYAISVAGPVAPATSPRTCGSSGGQHNLDYQGNGDLHGHRHDVHRHGLHGRREGGDLPDRRRGAARR